jgi:hypothetical protein
MECMSTPIIEVDFHLKADEEHTYGLLSDVKPTGPVAVGQHLLATDGEVSHLALVDRIDDEHGTLLLRVLWDERIR